MRGLAVAQLGSRGAVDDVEFSARLALAVVREILPPMLRDVARLVPSHRAALVASAVCCELPRAADAADAALAADRAADSAALAALAADSAADAADAALAARSAARSAALAAIAADSAADAADAALAARSAALAARSAARSAALAAIAADSAADARAHRAADNVLVTFAALVLRVLRELDAPGVALWDAVNAA
jgi:hypothetical protein